MRRGAPSNEPRRLGRGRAIALTCLSVLFPGAGQLAAGYYRRGMVMAALTLGIAGVAVAFWLRGTTSLLSFAVQPRALIAIFIVNAATLLFRLFSIVDVYRLGRTRDAARRSSRWLRQLAAGTALVALLTVTAGPHVVVGYYTFLTYDLLTSIFPSEAAAKRESTPTPDASPPPSPTSTPSPTPSPTSAPEPIATNTPEPAVPAAGGVTPTRLPFPTPEPTERPPTPTDPPPEPTPTPEPESEPEDSGSAWDDSERISVLLLGSDAGPGRSGARTDTIMVVSVDTITGQSAIFGVPRNLVQVPLAEDARAVLGMERWPTMINALYATARRHDALAPNGGDPGAMALKGAIGELLGIEIDYYAMVDMAGFVQVIDALGGVTIYVPEPIQVRLSPPIQGGEWRSYDIRAGEQHLDGHEALAYARSRTGSSDYHRMRRQRCLVGAVAEQSDPLSLLLAFPDLVPIIKESVQTDIPIERLPDFVMLRDIVDPSEVVTVGFTPPRYTTGLAPGGYPIPDVDLIQQVVRDAFNHDLPPPDTVETHCR